jgi:hypothetical protein
MKRFTALPEPSILVGNCYVRDEEERIVAENRPDRLGLIDLLLGAPFPINPSAYFYHKALHHRIGMYPPEEHQTMDLHFLFRAVEAAHVIYVDEFFGNFRFIEGTKSYEAWKSGALQEQNDAVFRKFITELSLRQKLLFYTRRTGTRLGRRFDRLLSSQ